LKEVGKNRSMISKEILLETAREHNYKPEILEKVYRLLSTLEQIAKVPFLKNRLVLKGGTALNLFCFKGVPRLSVDIDLNYIGKIDRSKMLEERPMINEAIEKILIQNQYEPYRNPGYYAGGKMVWRYSSVLGQKGNLEIDLNYMYRKPLWKIEYKSSALDDGSKIFFPVLNIHELAAGKLSALLSRTASRDLFDAHYLLTKCKLDHNKLRFAFVVYLGMTGLDPLLLSPKSIQSNDVDIRNRLMPVVRGGEIPRARKAVKIWAEKLTQELQEALCLLLPLRESEINFISRIQKSGDIDASLLTGDLDLQETVGAHPALRWAAMQASKKIQ